jgi:hypothetical protein
MSGDLDLGEYLTAKWRAKKHEYAQQQRGGQDRQI